MMSVDEMKKKRFRFLQKVYDITEGSETAIVDMWQIGEELGFDRQVTEKIVTYLEGESLIESRALGGAIGLSHYGVTEIEDALSNPNKPTTYFPAINVIMNSTVMNSQIQQSNNGQSQIMVINESYNELDNILQLINSSSGMINLSAQQKSEFDAKIQEIKNEIVSKNPNKSVISKGVDSIKRILEGVSSNVIASGLLTMLGKSSAI